MQNKTIFNLKPLKNRRVELRKNQTSPENKLWQGLRASQLSVKFRRQHGIGNYIVDFYCFELMLVVEIDGDSHYNEAAFKYDQKRDHYLNHLGLDVVRFTNDDVMNNYESVVATLLDIIKTKQSLTKQVKDKKQNSSLPWQGEG